MQLKNHNNVYLKILLFLTGNLFCAVLCEDTLPSKARLLLNCSVGDIGGKNAISYKVSQKKVGFFVFGLLAYYCMSKLCISPNFQPPWRPISGWEKHEVISGLMIRPSWKDICTLQTCFNSILYVQELLKGCTCSLFSNVVKISTSADDSS